MVENYFAYKSGRYRQALVVTFTKVAAAGMKQNSKIFIECLSKQGREYKASKETVVPFKQVYDCYNRLLLPGCL